MSNHLYQTLEFDKVLDDLARRTHCPLAAERLQALRPLSSSQLAQKSLARISELRRMMDSGASFPIASFNDIGPHLHAAAVERSYLVPEAFRQIHEILRLTARIYTFLEENRESLPLVHEAAEGLSPNPGLTREIDQAIDLDSLDIRDQASSALAAIRRQIARARERVRRQLEGLLDSLARKGILQERLITVRSGRWVLPVKETHRHLVKGALHDKSASGATVFLEPLETLELNNQIRHLEAEERHEIENILRSLTDTVRKQLPDLEQNLEVLVTIDCIHAAALASKALNQHEPHLNTDRVLKIKNGRHPLLVLKKAPLSNVVPLDLEIGNDFNSLVITGPNAGGKTVALKTVGLIALMVSCGLHVPADADSEVPIFNRIFARVGDAQSIEMDLSTFSAHLTEVKTIVEKASAEDLVLIDEIGAGTDPQEGATLAMAVLEDLTARGVVTLVTTHHGSLKAFAHETPGIANGSMAFDSQALTPIYKFRADLPGSSYALEIAKRMGLPEGIVARAKSLMGTQANRLEELILKLDQSIERNRQLERNLSTDRLMVNGLRERYEAESARLAREAKQIRHKAAQEADTIIRKANAAVEGAVRLIREDGASKAVIRQAKALIRQEEEAIEKELEATMLDEEAWRENGLAGELRPGDRVYWKRSNAVGTVLSHEDLDGRLLVSFGKVKVHVHRKELNRAKPVDETSTGQISAIEISAPENVHTETDIRGMHVEEALRVVDKFLDDALLAGLKEVRIIHGVGTGTLRSRLIPFLDQHPLVMRTSPGGYHQQNQGVTRVEIAGK